MTVLINHFSWYEVRSLAITFLTVFIGVLALEAKTPWELITTGNFSQEALLALGTAVGRSIVKAAWKVTEKLVGHLVERKKGTPEEVKNEEEKGP